jgi:hypothetical protein
MSYEEDEYDGFDDYKEIDRSRDLRGERSSHDRRDDRDDRSSSSEGRYRRREDDRDTKEERVDERRAYRRRRPPDTRRDKSTRGFDREKYEESVRNAIPYVPYAVVISEDMPEHFMDKLYTVIRDGNDARMTLRVPQENKEGPTYTSLLKKADYKERYAPWKGFNDTEDVDHKTTARAKTVYKKLVMTNAKDTGLTIAACKLNLIAGNSCQSPVAFLLIYTPDGATEISQISKETGFNAPYIRLARKLGIPVVNMANDGWDDRCYKIMGKYDLSPPEPSKYQRR